VANELMEREQEVALAILYLKLDPTSYAPQIKQTEKEDEQGTDVKGAKERGEQKGKFVEFSEWKTFPTSLEFDHQGVFHQIDSSFWKYEGGESKSFHTGI